jgi:hypothetical protein
MIALHAFYAHRFRSLMEEQPPILVLSNKVQYSTEPLHFLFPFFHSYKNTYLPSFIHSFREVLFLNLIKHHTIQ